MKRIATVLLSFTTFLGAVAAQLPLSAQFSAFDLGTPPGARSSNANAINNRGQVAVDASFLDENDVEEIRAFFWSRGEFIDLGSFGGFYTEAVDVNDRGQVVGNGATPSGDLLPFLWWRGEMMDISELGTFVRARAINNKGQVAGNGTDVSLPEDERQSRAAIWHRGRVTDLGTLGGYFSEAFAINNRGQVVGYSLTSDDDIHAFLWQRGRMTDLGTPGFTSFAYAINDRGQILGTSDEASDGYIVIWDKGRTIRIGTIGEEFQQIFALNNRGQIVGYGFNDSLGEDHAVIWDRGAFIDLGTLGGDFSGAFDINDRGQIAGDADTESDQGHAVIWER